MRAVKAPLLLLALVGCAEAEPRPEWLVVVATDAPVPQLGDRLLVEILDEDGALACSGCRRVLAVGNPASWPLSFSVAVPERPARLSLRARLHRADHLGPDGLPSGEALIDALGRLPAVDTLARVALVLEMQCFGVPAELPAGMSCDPRSRELAPAPTLPVVGDGHAFVVAGSWPEGQSAPCPSEPPPGMVCVPGGVVLLGSPFTTPPSDSTWSALPERLVRLSPFFLDADEMTVGAVRALVLDGAIAEEPKLRAADPKSVLGACTYLGAGDGVNDALPVNCVGHALAGEICAALGKRLPTEAEWEHAASNTGAESPFPWGHDEDVCAHAIVGRGRFGEAYSPEPSSCRGAGSDVLPWGPLPGGSEADVTTAGVRNLGGNVREWTADQLAGYVAPCWSGGAPALVDPLCDSGDPPIRFSIRGGGWASLPFAARGAERDGAATYTPNLGFRCASR